MRLGAKQFFQTRKKLPYDVEVEYLRGDGASWIDIGMKVPEGFWCEATVRLNESNSVWASVIGCRTSSCINDFQFSYQGNYTLIRYGTNTGRWYNNIGTGTHNIRWDSSGYVYKDGVKVHTLTFASPNPSLNLYVMAMNQKGVASQIATSKIDLFGIKFGNSSGVLRDMIPVRVGGVGYMYDRVSKQLFGNQGTGNFIVGPDVVEVEYLESTGTQYIDTGIVPTTSTDFSITVSDGIPNAACWIMGAQTWIGVHQKSNPREIGVADFSTDTYKTYTRYDGSLTTLELDGTSVYVNGLQIGTITRRAATTNLYLFGYYNTATSATSTFNDGRIYNLKIWENSVLVRDMVPVRVGMEGAMIDKLTRKIYRNAGAGAFKIGADKKNTPLMCNSYVKDGLIAMWDGVENAGWGTHDANATSIVDLAGGCNLNIIDTTTIGDDYFLPGYTGANIYLQSSTSLQGTVRAIKCTIVDGIGVATSGRFGILSISQAQRGLVKFAEWIGCGVGGTYQMRQQSSNTGVAAWSINYNSGSNNTDVSIFKNGEAVSGASTNWSGNAMTDGTGGDGLVRIRSPYDNAQIYNICLYNRALTAKEIAWNYEIDKRRFNLP